MSTSNAAVTSTFWLATLEICLFLTMIKTLKFEGAVSQIYISMKGKIPVRLVVFWKCLILVIFYSRIYFYVLKTFKELNWV